MNNAVLGEQLGKGVPNLLPFTAARSMAEPFHKLKFAAFSTYYDQVRSSTKHFVEKEGKKKLVLDVPGHRLRSRDPGRRASDQAKALKLEVVAEASYGPTDTEFVAPVTKLKSAGCDLVVMGSIIRDSIQAVGTAKKLGWTDVTFVGTAASYDPIVAAAAGGVMDGFYSATGMPFAYADTSSDDDQGLVGEVQGEDQPGPNSAAQYGYVVADIVVKALEASGKDLTRAKFLAALEGDEGLQAAVPRAHAVSYGADRRQGSTASVPGQGGRRPLEGGGREPALLSGSIPSLANAQQMRWAASAARLLSG